MSSSLLTAAHHRPLVQYTWDKQVETWVKKSGILGGAGKDPTVISPKQYSRRFRCGKQPRAGWLRQCAGLRHGCCAAAHALFLTNSRPLICAPPPCRIAMSSYLTVVPFWEVPEPPLDPDAM